MTMRHSILIMWPNLRSPDVHNDHGILSGAVHMCIKSENKVVRLLGFK